MTLLPKTILYRQVHPSWIQNGGISNQAFATSQTFKPTSKDENKLSVYDGDKYSAESSFLHFTQEKGLKSEGVLGVTVEEFNSQGLPCDPDDETFIGHVLVDYTSNSKSVIEKKSKKIRDIAMERGWLFTKMENIVTIIEQKKETTAEE